MNPQLKTPGCPGSGAKPPFGHSSTLCSETIAQHGASSSPSVYLTLAGILAPTAEQGIFAPEQGIFAPLARLAFRKRRPIEHKDLNMHASPLFRFSQFAAPTRDRFCRGSVRLVLQRSEQSGDAMSANTAERNFPVLHLADERGSEAPPRPASGR